MTTTMATAVTTTSGPSQQRLSPPWLHLKSQAPITASTKTKLRPSTSWLHREGLVNGVRLHWVEVSPNLPSSAPPPPLVLLLHGFSEFWYSWRFQLTALKNAGYRVVAPDFRGYNLSEASPASTGDYDLETLTTDMQQLLMLLLQQQDEQQQQQQQYHHRHMNKKCYAVIGHDFLGGAVAWELCSRHPNLVERLVLIQCPPLPVLLQPLLPGQQLTTNAAMCCCSSSQYCCCVRRRQCSTNQGDGCHSYSDHPNSWWLLNLLMPWPRWLSERLLRWNQAWLWTRVVIMSPSSPSSQSPQPQQQSQQQQIDDATTWKLYRENLSRPSTIHAMMEYYRTTFYRVLHPNAAAAIAASAAAAAASCRNGGLSRNHNNQNNQPAKMHLPTLILWEQSSSSSSTPGTSKTERPLKPHPEQAKVTTPPPPPTLLVQPRPQWNDCFYSEERWSMQLLSVPSSWYSDGYYLPHFCQVGPLPDQLNAHLIKFLDKAAPTMMPHAPSTSTPHVWS